MQNHSKTLNFDDWTYQVWAFDTSQRKFLEFIYKNAEECEIALQSFTDFGITAFICISDPVMEGKISETLLTPGTCFNA